MAKRGRPKIEIDLDQVEKLAGLFCTYEEIAAFLGVAINTMKSRKDFLTVYKRGYENGKCSLRRLQAKKAMEGNTTMLIWLGKQYLGQRDRLEQNEDGLNEAIDRLNDMVDLINTPDD